MPFLETGEPFDPTALHLHSRYRRAAARPGATFASVFGEALTHSVRERFGADYLSAPVAPPEMVAAACLHLRREEAALAPLARDMGVPGAPSDRDAARAVKRAEAFAWEVGRRTGGYVHGYTPPASTHGKMALADERLGDDAEDLISTGVSHFAEEHRRALAEYKTAEPVRDAAAQKKIRVRSRSRERVR